MQVLLAGSGGQVGRRVLVLLREAGYEVRAVTGRDCDLTLPNAAKGLAEGCDVVISCASASVSIKAPDNRRYADIDPVIHEVLLRETLRANAHRFVYLSVHVEAGYAHTAYVKAHERFVASLRKAPISSTVVWPTGIFSAFEDLLPMARRGVLPLIATDLARTNPIDPRDVAELMLKYLTAGPSELPCERPKILTRAQINQILAQVVGKTKVWMLKAPAWLVRMADLMEFFSAVGTTDCIAPALGERHLADYWRTC